MYSLLISTITNALKGTETILLGTALFVIIVAIGIIIVLAHSIAKVNKLIKHFSDKKEDNYVGVDSEKDSNHTLDKEITKSETTLNESIDLDDEKHETILDNSDNVTPTNLIEDSYVAEIDDDIIDDDDVDTDEIKVDIQEVNETTSTNCATESEDNIDLESNDFIESIDNSIIDDDDIIDDHLDEPYKEEIVSIDSEEFQSGPDPIKNLNEIQIATEDSESTADQFINSNVEENHEENPPIELEKIESSPEFIQPNDILFSDAPTSIKAPLTPEFIQSDNTTNAPELLRKPQRDDDIPLFSERENTDESAPESFEGTKPTSDFIYIDSELNTAPDFIANVHDTGSKVNPSNSIPEFSRPTNSITTERPDKLIYTETTEKTAPVFIRVEHSDSIEPPEFSSDVTDEDIEPPEFNYSNSLIDDIPKSFEESEKEDVEDIVDSTDSVFIAPIKPPPKGLYDEVPDNTVKENIEIEEPEILIPEGLTDEEKRIIEEQQTLLDQLTEESISNKDENYDIVGTCTDTAKFTAFEKKLYNATNLIKYYYSELKNTLLSYKGIKSKITNAGDSFKIGGSIVARITFNGNKLRLHLSLDPDEYNKSIYNHYSLADVKAYKDIPFALEISKSADLSTAFKLIQDAMGSKFVLYIDQKREYVDYATYYTDKED